MKSRVVLLAALLSGSTMAQVPDDFARCRTDIETLRAEVAVLRKEVAALKASQAGTAAVVANVAKATNAAPVFDPIADALQSVLDVQSLADREPVPPADFNQALSTAQAKVDAVAGLPRSRALKEILRLYALIGAIEDASNTSGFWMSTAAYEEIAKRYSGACSGDFRVGKKGVAVKKFPTACEGIIAQDADQRVVAFQNATQ
jgi:hypothetical protein